MPDIIDTNKRIARNTLLLYIRMFFTMAISLYTSRVVLSSLGINDFGVFNVIGGVIVLFGFLNNAMSASTQRFLTFEMGKTIGQKINLIFNISITIHLIIALIVILLSETIGLWFIQNHLNIPPDRINAANWVYQLSILSFIITILYVPYNAIIIAHERMGFYAIITTIEVILKLLIVFILAFTKYDKLITYSFLLFLVTLTIGLGYVVFVTVQFKESKLKFYWDSTLFLRMSSFANWNLFGVFAGIAYNQGVNILLNIFFGPVINAARGIAYQIQGAVNNFVINFQLAVNPQIIKSYAANNKNYLYSLIFATSKYSFFLLYLVAMPLLLETEFVLKLWLKEIPDYTTIFTRLILIDILIGSISGSLQTFAQATGNIKRYQIVVSGILLLNLPLSYISLKIGFEPQSTIIISIICSLAALAARLVVLKLNEEFPIHTFFHITVKKILFVAPVAIIFPVWYSSISLNSLGSFLITTIISITSTIISIFLLGTSRPEREYIITFIKNTKNYLFNSLAK